MKQTLLAGVSAIALLYAAPSLAAGPSGSKWAGCYVGANAGGGWGEKSFTDTGSLGFPLVGPDTTLSFGMNGYLVGGQIGCTHEIAPSWIVGIEGAFSAGDISGNGQSPARKYPDGAFTAKTNWIASITGRVGHSWGNWLAYVKGGAAWADDRYTATFYGPLEGAETRSGWTLGGGLEWAFATNWSARLEYDYFDFGTSTVTFTQGANYGRTKVTQKIHAVLLGVNYYFPVGPMPAMR